jgi:hypothetical protein
MRMPIQDLSSEREAQLKLITEEVERHDAAKKARQEQMIRQGRTSGHEGSGRRPNPPTPPKAHPPPQRDMLLPLHTKAPAPHPLDVPQMAPTEEERKMAPLYAAMARERRILQISGAMATLLREAGFLPSFNELDSAFVQGCSLLGMADEGYVATPLEAQEKLPEARRMKADRKYQKWQKSAGWGNCWGWQQWSSQPHSPREEWGSTPKDSEQTPRDEEEETPQEEEPAEDPKVSRIILGDGSDGNLSQGSFLNL